MNYLTILCAFILSPGYLYMTETRFLIYSARYNTVPYSNPTPLVDLNYIAQTRSTKIKHLTSRLQ